MAKQIKQFRYYGNNDKRNYPNTLKNYYNTLISDNLFNDHGAIYYIGIQGIPGTKFYLNESPHPITIGFTGIYELDLRELSTIYEIHFDKASIDLYNDNDNNHCLLIDIIYEGGNRYL